MKIPNKVASGMIIGSLAGMFGLGFVLAPYLSSKRAELLENSPAYIGLKGIEEKLPEYQSKLAACVPREKGAPVLESCVELAASYDSLRSQQTNLKNSSEYLAAMKKDATLESHGKNSLYSFPLFTIIYIVGSVASRNRKREEEVMKRQGDQ